MADAALSLPMRISRFAKLTGYTVKAVRHKIDRGVWLEGYEYHRAENGDITVDPEGFRRWAKGLPRVVTAP